VAIVTVSAAVEPKTFVAEVPKPSERVPPAARYVLLSSVDINILQKFFNSPFRLEISQSS
jgi:hypothetical protein